MKKKIVAFMLVVITLASMCAIFVSAVDGIQLTTEIADLTMSDLYFDRDLTVPVGDNTVTSDTEIFAWLNVSFKPAHQPTSSEQSFYYEFPSSLNVIDKQQGYMYDNNKVAGTYIVEDGILRFSFDDAWLRENSSDIKADFKFSFKISEETIGEGGKKEIVFPGIGTVVVDTISVLANASKTNSLANYAEDGTIEYTITLNSDNDVRSASVTDALNIETSGVSKNKVNYVSGSFKLDGVDISSNVSITEPTASKGASFVYPATGGVPLTVGVHTLTYKVKYDETDLYSARTVNRIIKNTASWVTDGIKLDDVISTVALSVTNIQKMHSAVKFDSVTNTEYIDWQVIINDSSTPLDVGGYTMVDTLVGAHSFNDIINSLKVVADDGTDITSKVQILVNQEDQFRIKLPDDAGRKTYTISYRTYLTSGYEDMGYKNRAIVFNLAGSTVGKLDGEDGPVGIGSKELDTSNITEEMLKGGGGANGQADWKITIPGNVYSIPSAFDFSDWLSKKPDEIWLKRSSVHAYDASVEPDTPVFSYTASDGSQQTLTVGVDFRITYGIQSTTGGERFSVTFINTDRTKDAFKNGITVSYSTESVGSAVSNTYRNKVQFNYRGQYFADFYDQYTVQNESNLYKVASETTRQNDGTFKTLWEAVVNGNKTEGKPTSPNMDLDGEEVYITDILPAGTKLAMNGNAAELLQFRVDGVNGNIKSWTTIPLKTQGYNYNYQATVTDNPDGTQTIAIRFRSDSLYPVDNQRRFMISLKYLTVTEAFDEGDYSSKNVTNSISANTATKDLGEATATTTVSNGAVNKSVEYLSGSGNQMVYTIHVNDGALELNEGNPLTLWDEFDPILSLVDGTVKVYYGDTNTELTDWTIAGEIVETEDGRSAQKYTFSNLPDSTHLRIVYRTVVSGEVGSDVNFTNTAALRGIVGHSSTVTERLRITTSDAGASGAAGSIKIIKVDASNINNKLDGAVFELYSVNMDTGTETLEATKTSVNGEVVFDRDKSGSALQVDKLYYYVEKDAPDGYILDNSRQYFILEGSNYQSVLNAATQFLGNVVPSSNKSYYAFNTPDEIELEIEKKWYTSDNQLIEGEALSQMSEITVNIKCNYTDEDGTEHSDLFETVKLNNGNNWKKEWKTSDLIGRVPKNVDYSFEASEVALENYDSEIRTSVDGKVFKISVKNTENVVPVELPDTGGSGEIMFVSIGLSLIAIGLFSALMLKKGNSGSDKIKIFKKKG